MYTGWTFFTFGDVESPLYKSDIQPNGALKNQEAQLIASFAKGDRTGFYKYLAVGGGTVSLFSDPANPPTAKSIIENELDFQENPKLYSEFFRTPLSSTRFIDPDIAGDNQFVDFNTGVVEFIWTISSNQALGTWKELGIFAGEATEIPSSGTLVHYQTLQDFNKVPSFLFEENMNWHWAIDFRKR